MSRWDDTVTPGHDDAEPEWVRQVLARFDMLDVSERAKGRKRHFSIDRRNSGDVVASGLHGSGAPVTVERWVFDRSVDELKTWCPPLLGSDEKHAQRIAHAVKSVEYANNKLSNLEDPGPIVQTVAKWQRRLDEAESGSLEWAKAKMSLHAAESRLARINPTDTETAAQADLDRAREWLADSNQAFVNELLARTRLRLGEPTVNAWSHPIYPELVTQ